MKNSTKVILAICCIILLGALDICHYRYKTDNPPMSFTEYMIKGYFIPPQSDAEVSPTSDLYRGF